MTLSGKGDSYTYATARALLAVREVLTCTPRDEHPARLQELAVSYYVPVSVLLGIDLLFLQREAYDIPLRYES